MGILANLDYWLAGVLFVGSQLIRSAALRTFISDVHVFRLRDVIGLNSIASLLNILGPFRIGEFFRVIILARKGLGLAPALFSIVAERSFDLSIILILLVLLGKSSWAAVVLLFAILFIQVAIARLMRSSKITPSRWFQFRIFNQLGVFFSSLDLLIFFGKLALAWSFSFLGVSILDSRHPGFLSTWIGWNSKFGEPFTLLISRNRFLIVVLVLPIVGLLLSSFLFKNSKHVANKALLKVEAGAEQAQHPVERVDSKFSGSGCEIYIRHKGASRASESPVSLMCKVEPKSRNSFLESQAEFMKLNGQIYNFPEVHGYGKTANFNYIVMENIIDAKSETQSENYASLISRSDQISSEIYLQELVEFLVSNKKSAVEIKSDLKAEQLERRLTRVLAYSATRGSIGRGQSQVEKSFETNVREILRLLAQSFNYDLDLISHGDATLSNFLRQETSSGFRIRAIDPNPRVQIGRLEYDFGKIMQSIDSMYEETMLNPEVIEMGIDGFIQRTHSNINSMLFVNSFELRAPNIDIHLMQLFHLTHLIRIIPYQYKHGMCNVQYWKEVINYQFEKNFK